MCVKLRLDFLPHVVVGLPSYSQIKYTKCHTGLTHHVTHRFSSSHRRPERLAKLGTTLSCDNDRIFERWYASISTRSQTDLQGSVSLSATSSVKSRVSCKHSISLGLKISRSRATLLPGHDRSKSSASRQDNGGPAMTRDLTTGISLGDSPRGSWSWSHEHAHPRGVRRPRTRPGGLCLDFGSACFWMFRHTDRDGRWVSSIVMKLNPQATASQKLR